MDRIRRFQRTLILVLTALNTFVYEVSTEHTMNETVIMTLTTTALAGSIIVLYAFYQRNKIKRPTFSKAEIKDNFYPKR